MRACHLPPVTVHLDSSPPITYTNPMFRDTSTCNIGGRTSTSAASEGSVTVKDFHTAGCATLWLNPLFPCSPEASVHECKKHWDHQSSPGSSVASAGTGLSEGCRVQQHEATPCKMVSNHGCQSELWKGQDGAADMDSHPRKSEDVLHQRERSISALVALAEAPFTIGNSPAQPQHWDPVTAPSKAMQVAAPFVNPGHKGTTTTGADVMCSEASTQVVAKAGLMPSPHSSQDSCTLPVSPPPQFPEGMKVTADTLAYVPYHQSNCQDPCRWSLQNDTAAVVPHVNVCAISQSVKSCPQLDVSKTAAEQPFQSVATDMLPVCVTDSAGSVDFVHTQAETAKTGTGRVPHNQQSPGPKTRQLRGAVSSRSAVKDKGVSANYTSFSCRQGDQLVSKHIRSQKLHPLHQHNRECHHPVTYNPPQNNATLLPLGDAQPTRLCNASAVSVSGKRTLQPMFGSDRMAPLATTRRACKGNGNDHPKAGPLETSLQRQGGSQSQVPAVRIQRAVCEQPSGRSDSTSAQTVRWMTEGRREGAQGSFGGLHQRCTYLQQSCSNAAEQQEESGGRGGVLLCGGRIRVRRPPAAPPCPVLRHCPPRTVEMGQRSHGRAACNDQDKCEGGGLDCGPRWVQDRAGWITGVSCRMLDLTATVARKPKPRIRIPSRSWKVG
jgi:hypothetical protein